MKDRLDDLLEVIRASDYFSLPELMDAAKLAIERNNLVQLETCEYSMYHKPRLRYVNADTDHIHCSL